MCYRVGGNVRITLRMMEVEGYRIDVDQGHSELEYTDAAIGGEAEGSISGSLGEFEIAF